MGIGRGIFSAGCDLVGVKDLDIEKSVGTSMSLKKTFRDLSSRHKRNARKIYKCFSPNPWIEILLFAFFTSGCLAQVDTNGEQAESAKPQNQLAVNWLYGAYIPRGVTIEPLTAYQRYRLFVRQSFTTPGIYIKTPFFSLHD